MWTRVYQLLPKRLGGNFCINVSEGTVKAIELALFGFSCIAFIICWEVLSECFQGLSEFITILIAKLWPIYGSIIRLIIGLSFIRILKDIFRLLKEGRVFRAEESGFHERHWWFAEVLQTILLIPQHLRRAPLHVLIGLDPYLPAALVPLIYV